MVLKFSWYFITKNDFDIIMCLKKCRETRGSKSQTKELKVQEMHFPKNYINYLENC